ncbi:cyclin box fold domain-containing protein [Naegleria gruberi]|uniref:Cyclin box fold domain-containing protein n=1 Tax=Naegleria gruberi TaxID=5762 RepID=D2VN70_NAEGR|nr:cyclin box fold domain-containing protein [Naegleria gruberi]EFC41600.1 cyclin box fold domain-containing protein [Naegleria gruberi]|eukprot:XP_002674344.1 cyclin box fold domain-containing protein [Naegleria gruberi strain NEG-M]
MMEASFSSSSSSVASPFANSSQKLFWIFKEKEEMIRVRDNAKLRVQKEILDLQEKYTDKKLVADDLLTPEEESIIVQKYCGILFEISTQLGYPLHVKATALSFMKRFYLKHSVMEYDIVFMMLTCIFLATKTEEKFVALANFLEKVNEIVSDASSLTTQIIFKYELVLLQGLEFHLMVYHPYRSLYAYVHDLHDVGGDAIYMDAQTKITEIIKMTDAIFLFSPSVVALGSLYMTHPDITKNFISKMFKEQEVQLMNQINQLCEMAATPVEKSKVKTADKKLKKIRKFLKPQLEELEEQYSKQIAEEQRVRREQKYQHRDRQQQEEQRKFL